MYEMDYVFNGDCDIPVYRARKVRATERSDMYKIEHALRMKCGAESNKLFRLAWRMIRHGCSAESVEKCRREARALHDVGGMNLWEVLNPFVVWEYAFKC